MPTVYLNGEYVDAEEARVSVSDRGLLLGFGLFETLRAYFGIPFRLARHLERLYSSARTLDLPLPAEREEIGRAVLKVLKLNGLGEARIRITFTGGAPPSAEIPMGSAIVSAVPVEGLPPEMYEKGVRVILTDLDKSMGLARHKTTDAMPKVIAHREAERAGAFEAVFRNPAGRISECATSNIFLVTAGELRTPPVSEGLLPGITREIVLSLARELGIPAAEATIREEDLYGADEVFVTASVKEIVPVVRVGEESVGPGRPGPLTRKIHEAYRARVRKECAGREEET